MVLLVDDNDPCLQSFSDILDVLGHGVRKASSGWEALDIFIEDPTNFSLVILDHVMPDLTGINTAQTLLQLRPDIPILLVTGWVLTDAARQRAKSIGIRAILEKPVGPEELDAAIRKVTEKPGASKG